MYNSFFYLLYLAAKKGYEELFGQNLSSEQIYLMKITGRKISHKKAEYLWARISDHKWYIGEKLQRDVGFNVAAIDFLENIAEIDETFGNCANSKPKIYAGSTSFA